MVTSTVTSFARTAYTFLAIACFVIAVAADDPTIRNVQNVPGYYTKYTMACSLTPSDSGPLAQKVPITPLTKQAGLNGTSVEAKSFNIQGNLVNVNTKNYLELNDPDLIAYMSCDPNKDDSFISPDDMFNAITSAPNKPKAVLLYSTSGMSCALEKEPAYTSIWTMVSNDEAKGARGMVVNSGGTIRAAITGSDSQDNSTPNPEGGGNNSAVAMSILYSITGLITLLFLIIIGTGAVRAHRHPERYGPRPTQSRARGLARAVLETLPIVKFGDPAPAKGDLEQELESVSGDHKVSPTVQTRETAATPDPRAETTAQGNSGPEARPVVASAPAAIPDGHENDENLGCSICTEDFTVGEDVRVLPCDHKFHPGCVDPWLVNVSGTCPLCRLDLRPQSTQDEENGVGEPGELSVQRSHGESESNEGDAGHRRRRSRLLDWNMLRHASVDERIRALRQFREQHGPSESVASEDRAGHNLADRLRDKFHIRTRAQPPRDTE
ncbi:Receptor-likey region transmembrane domain-containing protein 1 [Apiospora marii]|uniref:Receptor-likey region transmembrane domain-containing protein 1 n=1 Tax=Apiospora marii TaxID=335849 RepID=A0ABR1RAI8_9PEZI